MSNHLAIATVTRALGDLVLDAARAGVEGADVSYVRPGSAPAPPSPGVNVFLYGVTPNAALRNADLPTRRSGGALARRTATVLDLHYLLTFYGAEASWEPQRMLGSVAMALAHEPQLTRARIESVIAAAPLTDSDLADAAERVRFVPATLNLEELSKLWSVLFQTPYALSMVIQAGPVTLEAEAASRPALPVRARNLYVGALLGPTVDEVASASGPGAPILPDSLLVLRGRGLRGEVTRVRLGPDGADLEPVTVTPGEVMLPLASVPPAALRAGVQGARVVHLRMMGTPEAPHRGEESNVAAFVLRPVVRRQAGDPSLDDVAVVAPADPQVDPTVVRVRVSPLVGPRQRAELLLNESGGAARSLRVGAQERAADTDLLEFHLHNGLGAGTWLVRVVVDGAESVLSAGPGGTWERPRVVVP